MLCLSRPNYTIQSKRANIFAHFFPILGFQESKDLRPNADSFMDMPFKYAEPVFIQTSQEHCEVSIIHSFQSSSLSMEHDLLS